MKDLRAIKGTHYIRRLIEEGEHETQDFKYLISDARKIARSLSAFANHRGGRLLIGVKDNGVIAGVRNEEDIYMIEQAAQLYCRPAVEVRFTAFTVEGGLHVIRAEVDAVEHPPICVDEGGGRLVAYYRVADSNITAPQLMVEAWRTAASNRPLSLGAVDNSIVRAVAVAGRPVTLRHIMLACHLSERDALKRTAALIATKALSLRHTAGVFMITVAD